MAKNIDSNIIFLTTSPRTPEKMIPEIDLLTRNFSGVKWNQDVQIAFMNILKDEDFYHGRAKNDPAFSARDRINRGPKSLGFIQLKPVISLTQAGEALLSSKRKDEVFLRQILKFQIPSPLHKPTQKAANFWVKPYLEILRLIRQLGTLRFDELQLFGMQLCNYHDFDSIVKKIKSFRAEKLDFIGSYRTFKNNYLEDELKHIYQERINRGETKTRESADISIDNFLRTQGRNMRDYADACFRYLRATGLVAVSQVGKSLSIVPERIEDVDYILRTVSRDPVFVDDEKTYLAYLGDATTPMLLTDDRSRLEKRILNEFPEFSLPHSLSLDDLKNLFSGLLEQRKQQSIDKQTIEIKGYRHYNDIQDVFEQIKGNKLYDAPLMLEWNTWRAMTMMDGGTIDANLNFDDYGNPLSTAAGNLSDIVCDYGDFMLSVEVTMARGQRQYETEGEPVSRHLGKLKKASGKPCYCLFVAPTIHEACISHFYTLQHLNVLLYGGTSTIVPLPLNVFQKMLEDSYKASFVPNPTHLQQFFETSIVVAGNSKNEKEWYETMVNKATHWLE